MDGHSIIDAFAEHVRARPDHPAVSADDVAISYAALDAWSDAMAHDLATRAGIVPGDRVAVRVPRSPELVVALLAVLKAGAAYVPIDTAEPPRRVAERLDDAQVTVVVAGEDDREQLAAQGLPVVGVSLRPAAGAPRAPHVPAPHDVAYLMYTSGSTGTPKAAMIEHRNVVNLVLEPEYMAIGPGDRFLHLAPVAFDAATFEIWGALLNGAEIVLPPPGPVHAEELGEVIQKSGTTVLFLTAALFHRQIDLDPGAFTQVRTVVTGGDVISSPHVQALTAAMPHLQVINAYGPTETTVFVTCHDVRADEDFGRPLPIGSVLRNVTLRIVDDQGRAVPDGTTGELWVAGAAVGSGYWRRPELTAERFVTASPDGGPPLRYYRTGDAVCRRPDGVFEFHGRLDDQFKLRGFRIEPAEVETVLTAHDGVRACAVGVREAAPGDKRLVAWVVPAGAAIDRRALRKHLRDRVPEHMVPAVFVAVDELPVTVNGKVDRPKLPMPDWTSKSLYV